MEKTQNEFKMNTLVANVSTVLVLENNEKITVRQLFEQHFRFLCYFAKRLVNNEQEAEDIAVDSFIKLMKSKSELNSLPAIKSYLFTTARNACVDQLRKKKAQETYIAHTAFCLRADENFMEEEMLKTKVLQLIYNELETLPPQCKMVFKLLFFKGKSTEDVASEMNISKQTVLNQKSKAIRLLRTKLLHAELYTLAAATFKFLDVLSQARKPFL